MVKKARQSVNKIKNSGKTHAHKIQAAIAMSQKPKLQVREQKTLKRKKIWQAHKVYQTYIDTKKKRINMELLIGLAMKFWQWSLLIAFVIIGFAINLFDKKKPKCYTFAYTAMPDLRPLPIKTKGKGFFKAIVMWLLGTRNWEVINDFTYVLNGNKYVICWF